MIYFSTRSFEPDERRDAWACALAQYCGPFDFETRCGLEAQMERQLIAGLPCVRLAQNSLYMRRSQREVQRSRPDFYYVMLQLAGRSRISQCGSESDMVPGDLIVLDSGRAMSMDYSGKNIHLCFHLPRTLLETPAGSAPKLGIKLPAAPASLAGALMQEGFAHAAAFDQSQGEAMRDSLISLVRAAFSTALSARSYTGTECNPSETIRLVRSYIARNLGSEDLSPRTIAQACGVSVRHIHRLFTRGDLTLTGWIRRCRLDRCALDLRSSASRGASITDIALRWGFNDLAHFSRSFRAQFGYSPREYRASAFNDPCRTPTDCQEPQATPGTRFN